VKFRALCAPVDSKVGDGSVLSLFPLRWFMGRMVSGLSGTVCLKLSSDGVDLLSFVVSFLSSLSSFQRSCGSRDLGGCRTQQFSEFILYTPCSQISCSWS
jgi:hypothetical protein